MKLLSILSEEEEEGHARLKVKELFFYVDNRMVASTNPGWIQIAFDTLNGIFNRVGLQKNAQKTVWMVCQPCQASWVNAG